MPPSGSVLLMPGAGDANPFMEGDARIRIVPVCRTNKDHCPAPMVPSWNLSNPISSSSSVKSNPTELRFLFIAIWLMFDLIPLDLILHWIRCSYCVRIISITATLVNVGFAMFVRFGFVLIQF